MSNKELFAFRCPQDLKESIETQVKQTHKSKTDVVIDMLQNSVPSVRVTERSQLPSEPAVYFVFTPDNRVLYIGRSNNLRRRWNSHHIYQKAIDASVDSRIGWFSIDDSLDSELSNIEQELGGTEDKIDSPADSQFSEMQEAIADLKNQVNALKQPITQNESFEDAQEQPLNDSQVVIDLQPEGELIYYSHEQVATELGVAKQTVTNAAALFRKTGQLSEKLKKAGYTQHVKDKGWLK